MASLLSLLLARVGTDHVLEGDESQGHQEAERPGLGALEKEKLGDGEKGGGRKGRAEGGGKRQRRGGAKTREGGRMEGVGRGRGRNLQ